MTGRRESRLRTLGIAAVVAFACSLLVSTVVYFLRPIELAYSALDRNRAVLEAVGVPAETDRDVVDEFVSLDVRAVDLETGQFTDVIEARSYDFKAAMDNPSEIEPIPAELDVGRLQTRPRYMPVYVLREDDAVARLALPIYARGMWSTIFGLVALESDLSTIAGARFYELGETAGIGDRIQNPAWLAAWVGKRIYDEDGVRRFRITSDRAAVENDYRVDSITGATVTADAVDAAMRYWFSEHGYGPFLRRLREEGL